jgi:hypothetical protein
MIQKMKKKEFINKWVKDGRASDDVAKAEDDFNRAADYYGYEVMDRACTVLELFIDKLEEHPAVERNQDLKDLTQKTIDQLYHYYNTAAKIFFEENQK